MSCPDCHDFARSVQNRIFVLNHTVRRSTRSALARGSAMRHLRKAYEAGDWRRVERLLAAHTPERLGPVRRPAGGP